MERLYCYEEKGDNPPEEADRKLRCRESLSTGPSSITRVRGTGPPVLLIMGATGDGGHFDELADLLADEFTVVSYDRRGNGRSPVPDRLGDDLTGGAGR